MRTTKLACLVLAAALALVVAGCGSNRDSDGSSAGETGFGTDPATGYTRVGAATCIGCHEDFSWSDQIVQDYLGGKHVVHSDHISQANAGDGCLQCHDPIGDGPTLEQFLEPENIPEGGLAAIGCENCHGAGGEHFGVGPIPRATPNYEVCGQCHAELPDSHLQFHPEGNNIVASYENSRHNTASIRNEAVCAKCHTDEGGRLYKNVQTRESLFAHVLPVPGEASPVQCRTCHNPHAPNELLLPEIEDHGHVVASAEYATCTNCHMSDQVPVEELLYHEDRHMRVITDSHYDDPATTDQIEGYVVDHHSERPCRTCHNPHDVMEIRADRNTTTINDQWAQSAHGGHLLTVKKEVMQEYIDMDMDRTIEQTAAMKAAGATDAVAPAWVHYNWDDTSSRGDCQRCHTATGVKNFLTDQAGYLPENNDFSYLADWSAEGGSPQNEMLYCWGCHTTNTGNLRAPGPITPGYAAAPDFTYPDISGSNVCMACHTGRETGASIAELTPPLVDARFVNSHYLTAGGTLFAATGYEYDIDGNPATDNYTNVAFFAHDQIGLPDGNGPCVGCHMSTEESHLFLPVEINETTGTIEAITSDVCVGCHSGGHGPAFVAKGGDPDAVAAAAAFLEAEAEELAAALDALGAKLAALGHPFVGGYPYFAAGDWTSDFDADGRPTMGAAFNFNLLLHDPGAYAHNRYYTKRLIYDSLDFLGDGLFNGSVGADIDALAIDATTKAAAKAYLDGDAEAPGVQRPGGSGAPPADGGGGTTDGSAIFAAAGCSGCHGADGAGVGSFPNIQNISQATLLGAPAGVGTHGTIATWSAEEQQAVLDFLAGL